jgi:hypothetical protein
MLNVLVCLRNLKFFFRHLRDNFSCLNLKIGMENCRGVCSLRRHKYGLWLIVLDLCDCFTKVRSFLFKHSSL